MVHLYLAALCKSEAPVEMRFSFSSFERIQNLDTRGSFQGDERIVELGMDGRW
ncbi:MAG: hypothetical protein HXS48_23335 [Theionarchaea archaeon]|nr:hypothetical protein [Theionarchaea archaeon]